MKSKDKEQTPNKYWSKLCTPEQNNRQVTALAILAIGLTTIFVISYWL